MPGAACAWANEGMANRQNRKKLMMPLGLRPVMEMYMGYLSLREIFVEWCFHRCNDSIVLQCGDNENVIIDESR